MFAKQILDHRENIGIELRRLRKGFRARVGVETRVANRQSKRACGQSCFAQPLAGLLRKMAQHRHQHFRIVGILAEGVIV